MSHLVVARSVVARLDPALLGRLDPLLAAAAVARRLLLPLGRVREGRGRWGPAVVLVRRELGELDDELELAPTAVGGGGAGDAAAVRIGAGRLRLRRPPVLGARRRRRWRGREGEEVVDERAGGRGGGAARPEGAAWQRRRRAAARRREDVMVPSSGGRWANRRRLGEHAVDSASGGQQEHVALEHERHVDYIIN